MGKDFRYQRGIKECSGKEELGNDEARGSLPGSDRVIQNQMSQQPNLEKPVFC